MARVQLMPMNSGSTVYRFFLEDDGTYTVEREEGVGPHKGKINIIANKLATEDEARSRARVHATAQVTLFAIPTVKVEDDPSKK